MRITFLDLLQKHIFLSKSHDNFVVTAWEPRIWNLTLVFVFSFLRKCRQGTYPLSSFLISSTNLLTTPSMLPRSMHCLKENASILKWCKKKSMNYHHCQSCYHHCKMQWAWMNDKCCLNLKPTSETLQSERYSGLLREWHQENAIQLYVMHLASPPRSQTWYFNCSHNVGNTSVLLAVKVTGTSQVPPTEVWDWKAFLNPNK